MKTILALLLLYTTSCAAGDFLPFWPTDPRIEEATEVKKTISEMPYFDEQNPHAWRVERIYSLKFAEGQIRTARTFKDFYSQADAEQFDVSPLLQNNDVLVMQKYEYFEILRDGKSIGRYRLDISLPEPIKSKIVAMTEETCEMRLSNADPRTSKYFTFGKVVIEYLLALEDEQKILLRYEISGTQRFLENLHGYYQKNPLLKVGDEFEMELFMYQEGGFCGANLPAKFKPAPPDEPNKIPYPSSIRAKKILN